MIKKDLPEGFKKRHAENHLMGLAVGYKLNNKELSKHAYDNLSMDDEEILEEISAEHIKDLSSAVVSGWVLVEKLIELVNEKEEELFKIGYEKHKED